MPKRQPTLGREKRTFGTSSTELDDQVWAIQAKHWHDWKQVAADANRWMMEAENFIKFCTQSRIRLTGCFFILFVPSSPLEALFKHLRSLLHLRKASSSREALKPPSSPLEGEAPLKPLEAPFKPPSSLSKPPSPLKGFKPPSSPLQALPSEGKAPLEAFQRWSPLQAFVKSTFKGCFAGGEASFVTEECPSGTFLSQGMCLFRNQMIATGSWQCKRWLQRLPHSSYTDAVFQYCMKIGLQWSCNCM